MKCKPCITCKKVLPVAKFFLRKSTGNLDGPCRKCRTDYNKGLTRKYRIAAIDYYSKGTRRCVCCGEGNLVFLVIDHIGGGGNKHRKVAKLGGGSSVFYFWLKKNNYPPGFRILCHNCNYATIFGPCPHEKERPHAQST